MKPAVFRLQLFKPSEPFIAGQAKALPTAKPVLVGRTLHGKPDPGLPHWSPGKASVVSTGRFLTLAHLGLFMPLMRSQKFDLVHAHFAVDGLYALPIAQRLDVPLLTTLHGFDVTTARSDFLRSGRPALVRYALLQSQLKKAGSLFICVSRFMYESALRAGYPEKRLVVHYMGIDTSLFQPRAASGRSRLIHIARLVEKKGTRYLIDAMAQVVQRHPGAVLDVIGDGPLRASLEAQVSALGLQSAINFHGAQPQSKVREMVAASSALVLPSVTAANGDAEGLGLVLLEAGASGVPVIGTRHGGIPEVVEDGGTGLLVPERDANALAEALDTLLSSDSLRERMGAQARARACAEFDLAKQSAKLEDLYRTVL